MKNLMIAISLAASAVVGEAHAETAWNPVYLNCNFTQTVFSSHFEESSSAEDEHFKVSAQTMEMAFASIDL